VVQRIQTALRARGLLLSQIHDIPVYVALQTETGFPHSGSIDYIAPTVDADSGTLSVRALMPNTDYSLLPGMFVRVRVPLGLDKNAILVPDTAVGSDQGGAYLLVVDDQDVVQEKPVKTGSLFGSLRVIESGIAPTDKVVVNGLQLAIPGEKVVPQNAPPLVPPANIDTAE